MKHQHTPTRSGFTLMETVLAMVLGAMVLLGSSGVFLSLRGMESAFSSRFDRTSELGMTQTIMTRSMLNLQMAETENTRVSRTSPGADTQNTESETQTDPDPRPRMILETDLSAAPDSTKWAPQRFELVTATPPVPANMASQAAGWYVDQDRADSLDYSAADGSQGAIRGVFELRPAGQREALLQQIGLLSASQTGQTKPKPNDNDTWLNNDPFNSSQTSPNWTLWWRPILSYEGRQLAQEQGPFPDSIGTVEEIRARLAGAVPLLSNIERCVWEIFKGDEYMTAYAGTEMKDLPAYAQFEVILTTGQYASWMFEVDWVLGDDPNDTETTSGNGQDEGGSGTDSSGNGNDRPGGPRRPGGNVDPDRVRNIDFGNDS